MPSGDARIDLPDLDTAQGVAAATSKVIEAMVAGEIDIAPAQAVLAMLGEARQAHELGDIERRLGALEQQKGLRK